jgi:hypothetical protein
MKKLLLASILFVFACSSDDNGNTNSDPIVGTWEIFYSEGLNTSNVWDGSFETEIGNFTYIFKSDGSYDVTDSGVLYQNVGTWTNNGNNIYKITQDEDEYFDGIEFLCSNNILVYDEDVESTNFEYYQKEGYNYQNCNEITYNANN